MIRRKGPILAAVVVGAFALGWYRGLFGIGSTDENVVSVADAPVEQAAAVRSLDRPNTVPRQPGGIARTEDAPAIVSTDAPNAASQTPGFDVVRVEPDGSAVVAGKGAANQSIALTNGTQTLGEAQTDANGDFVMSLSIPEGSHRLQLAQRDDLVSDEAAVINVPPAGRSDQLLVMVQRPGEASEVLQRPQQTSTATEASPASRPESETEMAAIATDGASRTPDVTAPTVLAGVAVEAVEIEGDQLFVAGSAPTGSRVRLYLDDRFVTDTLGGDGDRFIARSSLSVPVGEHTVRADLVDAAGRVLGRVEVPFQRQEGASMSAIAAPPPKPVQEAEHRDASVVAEPASSPAPSTVANTAPPIAPMSGIAESSGAGEPAVVVQAPLQAFPSRVIIRRGDTLWRISRDTYGRGSRYTVIYLANGDQIRDPNRIYPGQVFRMPDSEGDEAPPRG